MAENSVHNLSYKSISDNDKAEIIQTELKQFTIALQIMAKYPEVLNEYRSVLGGVNHHRHAYVSKNQIVYSTPDR